MTVTPDGSPPWVRTAGITDYGGHTGKYNYMSQGVVNAKTDVGAAGVMRLADNLAAVVRTAPWAIINYTQDDTGTDDPTVNYVLQMNGVRFTSYAGDSPPTGFPSLIRNGNGDVTITWSSSYTDAYGVSGTLALIGGKATDESTNTTAPVQRVNAYTMRVRCFTASSGAAATDKRITAVIY